MSQRPITPGLEPWYEAVVRSVEATRFVVTIGPSPLPSGPWSFEWGFLATVLHADDRGLVARGAGRTWDSALADALVSVGVPAEALRGVRPLDIGWRFPPSPAEA